MKVEEYNQAYSIGFVDAMKTALAIMEDFRSGRLQSPEAPMSRLKLHYEEVAREMAECLQAGVPVAKR